MPTEEGLGNQVKGSFCCTVATASNVITIGVRFLVGPGDFLFASVWLWVPEVKLNAHLCVAWKFTTAIASYSVYLWSSGQSS
jgi:hypothetical protein